MVSGRRCCSRFTQCNGLLSQVRRSGSRLFERMLSEFSFRESSVVENRKERGGRADENATAYIISPSPSFVVLNVNMASYSSRIIIIIIAQGATFELQRSLSTS